MAPLSSFASNASRSGEAEVVRSQARDIDADQGQARAIVVVDLRAQAGVDQRTRIVLQRGEVGEHRCIELDDVVALEADDDVVTEARPEHEGIRATLAEQLVVALTT